jgi:hypothetical protein
LGMSVAVARDSSVIGTAISGTVNSVQRHQSRGEVARYFCARHSTLCARQRCHQPTRKHYVHAVSAYRVSDLLGSRTGEVAGKLSAYFPQPPATAGYSRAREEAPDRHRGRSRGVFVQGGKRPLGRTQAWAARRVSGVLMARS